MIRILVPPGSLVRGTVVVLTQDEGHHLQVRRAEATSTVQALDGHGTSAVGRLEQSAGKSWQFSPDEIVITSRPPQLLLAVAAGDRDRFQMLIEKTTELGVTRIIPLETERSKQVATRLRESALDKCRRQALEACKQSGNPWAPIIDPIIPIATFLTSAPAAQWLLADPDGATINPLDSHGAIGWLVGPEGGFTADERALIQAHLTPQLIGLGGHILRFETAAIAAVAVTGTHRQRG